MVLKHTLRHGVWYLECSFRGRRRDKPLQTIVNPTDPCLLQHDQRKIHGEEILIPYCIYSEGGISTSQEKAKRRTLSISSSSPLFLNRRVWGGTHPRGPRGRRKRRVALSHSSGNCFLGSLSLGHVSFLTWNVWPGPVGKSVAVQVCSGIKWNSVGVKY